jgi:Fe(3+) dicitrate transport protein
MEGVEVLKGSSQIKYGPATIGGCLNLISTSVPTSPKAFAQASIGSFGTSQLRAFAGSRINNISFVVEANRLASAGFKQLPNNGNTGFDRRDAMAKIKWESNANARVQQSISMKLLAMQELGNESYLGLTYEDFVANPYQRYAATQLDKLTMNHRTATLNHTIKLSKNVNISTTAYYARTFRDWARVQTIGGVSLNNILQNPTANDTAYSIMTGKIDGALTYQTAARTYHSKGLQTTLQGKWNIGNFVHKVELGLRLHADEADRYATLSNYEMKAQRMTEVLQGMNGNAENQLRNASALAGYVHYELKNRNLKITPGIRIEKINFDLDNYGNNDYERQGTALKQGTNNLLVVLPGIGVHYSLCKYGGIFGGIHQGFSPPGMPNVSTGATQAKPEMAVNFELGYRFTNDYFKTQIVGFYNDYNNILGTDNVSGGGAGTGELFNAGNAKISGVECSVEYDLMQLINKKSNIKLPLAAAYTLTNARFSDTFVNAGGDWGTGLIQSGDNIPFITPQLFAATLGIEINNFDATLSGRYTGQTRTKPGQGEVLVPNTSNAYKNVNTIDSYFVMDLSFITTLRHS